MAFIDKLSETVAQISVEASQKTKEITENVKVQSKLYEQKKELKKLYETLGECLYRKEEIRNNPDYATVVNGIKKCLKEIQELEKNGK